MISPLHGLTTFAAGFTVFTSTPAAESGGLPRSTPEKQGVSPAQVRAFVEALDTMDQVHSAMIVHHGNVVTEGKLTTDDEVTVQAQTNVGIGNTKPAELVGHAK